MELQVLGMLYWLATPARYWTRAELADSFNPHKQLPYKTYMDFLELLFEF